MYQMTIKADEMRKDQWGRRQTAEVAATVETVEAIDRDAIAARFGKITLDNDNGAWTRTIFTNNRKADGRDYRLYFKEVA